MFLGILLMHFLSKKHLVQSGVLVALLLAATACSSTKEKVLDYKTPGVKSVSDRLIIPPDITEISSENKYQLPGGAIRASEYNRQKSSGVEEGATLSRVKGVHIERSGQQRWLVVEGQSPEELWKSLHVFWQNMGFVIAKEDQRTGFMETHWAENRAQIPGDPIRDFFVRIGLDSIYSSGVRDKFLIRIEPGEANSYLVTFTNQKREEVLVGQNKETSKWVIRPSDHNLEAQFLAQYMLALGYAKRAVAKELSNTNNENLLATLKGDQLLLKGDHARNKYRLKLALDRVGLTVLEAVPTSDTLIVSPAPEENKPGKNGFLGKIFGVKRKPTAVTNEAREKIYVTISPAAGGDRVQLYTRDHVLYPDAEKVLKKLYMELR